MTTAEVTSEVFKQAFPNNGVKVFYVKGTAVQASDFFTVSGLKAVKGAYIISSTGTAGTCTFATNVVTVTNADSVGTWSGLVWGV